MWLIATVFFLFSACKSAVNDDTSWYLNTKQLWKDYYAAVDDARNATFDEICYTLPAIVFLYVTIQ